MATAIDAAREASTSSLALRELNDVDGGDFNVLAEVEGGARQTVDEFIELWTMTTDAGPDISACRKMFQRSLTSKLRTLYFEGDCFAHQYHLIVMTSRARVNGAQIIYACSRGRNGL